MTRTETRFVRRRELIYACGMDRTVAVRTGPLTWKDLSAPPATGAEQVVGFESFDGYSAKDLYAVGWQRDLAAQARHVALARVADDDHTQRGVLCRGRGSLRRGGWRRAGDGARRTMG